MLQHLYQRLRRTTNSTAYLPEVDGIRFMAIAMVVLFHIHSYFLHYNTLPAQNISYTRSTTLIPLKLIRNQPLVFTDNPNGYALLNTFTLSGDRGVELFFVLSGFILALPFARHYLKGAKKITLGQYYIRRLRRIEPPYLIALTGIFLLRLLMAATSQPHSATSLLQHYLASAGYSHLLIYHQLPFITTIAWSLEIEIQFYIVAPIVFQAFRLNAVTRRSVLFGALFGLILFHYYFIIPPLRWTLPRFLPYFLTGIIVADLYTSGTGKAWFQQKWVAGLMPLLLASIFFLRFKIAMPDALFFPIAVGALYLIILENKWVKKAFSFPAITTIGGMCYSIYLVHYTIIAGVGKYTTQFHLTPYYLPNLTLQFIVLGAIVLLVSTVFYVVAEQPFMNGRKR